MTALGAMLTDGAVHVLDGAMGTLLYERGVFVNVCYDELNLTEPGRVEGIHREYMTAGAEILETNTFGANPVKLSGFGLEARTEEINRAAVSLARRAASGRAVVVGGMGPLGLRIEPWGATSQEEAQSYFRRQAEGLREGGVDGFLLETFSDLNELHQALLAVRSISDLPIFAQVTIEEGGATSYGTDVEAVAQTLDEWGADVIGVNCSVGPVEILEAVERMARVTDRPLVAQPNAGFPRLVGDRKIYLASPGYMARYACRMVEAGARFIGGCCGTTPDHIREIRAALTEMEGSGPLAVEVRYQDPRQDPNEGLPMPLLSKPADGFEPAPLADRSPLGRRLAEGTFVTSLELVPPRGWDPTILVENALRSEAAELDAISLVDAGPGLRRMAALPAAILLEARVRLEVVVHYSCRNRNMLQMISDFLGAAAAGLRNVLVISGDPSPTGPYPDHTAVFDIDAIGLTNILDHLNRGVDPGGQRLDPPTRFVVGVAVNQGAADLAREERRFRWKIDAGADFAVTQPVFDPGALTAFLDRVGDPRVPVLAGIWPLTSLRDAEYLSQEVPGALVPRDVLTRMEAAEAKGQEFVRDEGRKITLEVLESVLPVVQGVHIHTSRAGLELGIEVARQARQYSQVMSRDG